MTLHRRDVLRGLGAAGALALGGRPLAVLAEAALAPTALDTPPFRVIELAAQSHLELGRLLGEALREEIHAVLAAEGATFARCTAALQNQLRPAVDAMQAAAAQAFPDLVKELAGMSEGAGVPYLELFAWNCRSELRVLTDAAGCSTAGLPTADGFLLAHNEDGAAGYQGHMVVVKVVPPSGVAFAALAYPGTLPGLGPVVNERGVLQTTNYISPTTITPGVPRFFIGRATCEARDLDHAVAMATTPGRAFPWHHNLGSLLGEPAKLVSLETWPDGTHDLQPVEDLHLHTNHLTHSAMADLPEDRSYYDQSSGPRMAALERLAAEHPPQGMDDLMAMLADRSGHPTRLCRHPGDDFPGVTVATATFTSGDPAMTLHEAAPCFGRSMRVEP